MVEGVQNRSAHPLEQTLTVCAHSAGSMMPMPLGDGQISLLISLSCQRMWLSPRVGPAANTSVTQASKLSRQNTQPLYEARRKRTATSSLPAPERYAPVAHTASCNMAVPTSLKLITFNSPGVYSAPVAGLTCSST